MPIERVGEILSGFQRIQAVAGPGEGFDRILAAVGGGGPVLELDNDPRADAILAGASPAEVARAEPVDAAWVQELPAAGQEWSEAISEAAADNGIDPRLLAAVVWSESAFNPGAVSRAGALGLAQLMPGTAAGLGVDPSDPVQNLDGGARYLRQQLDRFGTVELALAAYNAGPGRVANAGDQIPQIAETQAYVRVVMDRYSRLGGPT